MYKSLVTVCLALFATGIDGISRKPYEDRFHDYGIYTISNRAYVGVLTFNGTDQQLPVLTDWDKNVVNPGQRWRLNSQTFTSAFELRPMLDDRFVLEYWNDQNTLRWIASWGWGDNKVWYLQDAGDGFTLVKNKQNSVCLKSQGILNPIVAEVCNGKPEQQWKFDNLPGA